MPDQYPMTPRGLQMLREELKHRKEVERPRIVRAIEEARAHGDLSENAEYAAAKEAQSHNEGRIGKLEEMIALANVIDPQSLSGDRVVFGATVTIEEVESGERQTFAIVGEHEADIRAGRMAVTAPVARALIGKALGDTVQVRTPRGNREYEIVDVKFLPLE
ncbi:MAG: transcription elongation factor GreA [Myxococcales bacterium]|nr:transcription elongation factor GreA [Myxococcota bacterium]MDW8281866.1 transcription elongation factor GreA [Myxococcales bacterium]